MNASWIAHVHKAYGVQSMWNVEATFFAPVPGRKLGLREDWKSRWHNLAAAAGPVLASGACFGFFILDEGYAQGVQPAELSLAADAIRSSFPDAITWVNFCPCGPFSFTNASMLRDFPVPPSLSWASIDLYNGQRQSVWPTAPFVPAVQRAYQQMVFPRLLPNQSAMLVPGSWSTDLSRQAGWCNLTCGDAKSARDAHDFYEWALAEERVVGLAVWNWGGCGACTPTKDEIGTAVLPKAKAAWMQIGRAIARKTDDTGARSLAAQREYWPTKAWRKAAPAAQGFNASALAEAARYLRTTNQKSWDKKIGNDTWLTRHIDAFLVVRGGFVVHEQYWTPNGRKGVPHDVASATKSIAWMALAHAAMQGKLSLETRVADFFPNLESDPPCKMVILSRFVCCPSR